MPRETTAVDHDVMSLEKDVIASSAWFALSLSSLSTWPSKLAIGSLKVNSKYSSTPGTTNTQVWWSTSTKPRSLEDSQNVLFEDTWLLMIAKMMQRIRYSGLHNDPRATLMHRRDSAGSTRSHFSPNIGALILGYFVTYIPLRPPIGPHFSPLCMASPNLRTSWQ
jgi:hypothetical protein